MARRALLATVVLAAVSVSGVLLQPSAEAGSIEEQQKRKGQSSKRLYGLEEKRQKPSGFVPSPGSLRQIRNLSDPARQRIRRIVESSRWMALRQKIDRLAAANNIPLPPRAPIGHGPPPTGPPPAGPPPPSRVGEEKLASDLLAAMIGADEPKGSNSSTGQRKALEEIQKLQKEADQEWLKVWTAVRPVLSPENLKELRLINDQQASRYPAR